MLGPTPFRRSDATHILIADFYGLQPGDSQFAQSVSEQVNAELKRFEEEELPNFPVHVPESSMELRRLRCFIDSHTEAEAIATAWGADLVVWGKAYCNPTPDDYINIQTVNARTEVGGRVMASGQAQQRVGTVELHAPEVAKAYTVCPSATLHLPDATLRRTSTPLDVMGLGHLDLPTLSSSAPFQLVDFALGLHFYERDAPWVATYFFKRSVERVMTRRDAKTAPLYGYLSRAYLELPDGQEQAIAYAQLALDQGDAGTPIESFLRGNIAAAKLAQGKFQEAEQDFSRALTIAEEALGANNSIVATLLNNVGGTQLAQGKHEEAERNFRRALATAEKAVNVDSAVVAACVNNIGEVLSAQGNDASAEQHFRRALSIAEKALGFAHPNIAAILKNLGKAQVSQGNYAEAERTLRRALAIDQATHGSDHPNVATDLNNLGGAMQGQHRYAEAEQSFQRALAIQEKALGPVHPALAPTLVNLGDLQREQGDRRAAEQSFQRALSISETASGLEDSGMVRACLVNLGMVQQEQERHIEAARSFQRALAITERAFGAESPDAQLLREILQMLDQRLGAKPVVTPGVSGTGRDLRD